MAALHTEQLEYLLNHLVHRAGLVDALGVFPANCLPVMRHKHSRNVCFILNTEPQGSPGKHWLAFYFDCVANRLEYFDSFGLPITMYPYVSRVLFSKSVQVTSVNPFGMLQSDVSTACGFYCVLFLHYRSFRYSAVDSVVRIRKLARTNGVRDMVVVHKVHNLMHKHRCSALPSVDVCTRQTQNCASYACLAR